MSYIYKITNEVNSKVYIGQTNGTIETRFKEHCYDSKRDLKNKFHAAMQEIGVDKFHVSLLEKCNYKDADERERYWITQYNSYEDGYNSTPGGQQGLIGVNPEYCIQYYLDNCDTKTITQITKELGVHTNKMRDLLEEAGIRKKQKHGEFNDWSEEEKAAIIVDAQAGVSMNQMTRKYHHDSITIKALLLKNNITWIDHSAENKATPIWQLTLNGEFVAEWPSIYSAKQAFKNQHIGECVNGKRKSAAGYCWIKKPSSGM